MLKVSFTFKFYTRKIKGGERKKGGRKEGRIHAGQVSLYTQIECDFNDSSEVASHAKIQDLPTCWSFCYSILKATWPLVSLCVQVKRITQVHERREVLVYTGQ